MTAEYDEALAEAFMDGARAARENAAELRAEEGRAVVSDPTPRWHDKFQVIRRETGEEVTEAKFTLIPSHDPHARTALLAYADACQGDNPGLAEDIRNTLETLS